ncbi:hypothetical protein MMPV_007287 [Pyropia vietnamensis]
MAAAAAEEVAASARTAPASAGCVCSSWRRCRRPRCGRVVAVWTASLRAATAALAMVLLCAIAPLPAAAQEELFRPAPPPPDAVIVDDTLPGVDFASTSPFRSAVAYNFFGRAVAGIPSGVPDTRRLVVSAENAYEVGELRGAGRGVGALRWVALYNQSSTPFRTSNLGVSLSLINGTGSVRTAASDDATAPPLTFVAADDYRALLYLGWPEEAGGNIDGDGGAAHTHGLWANASAPAVGFDSDYAGSRAAKWGSSTASFYRAQRDATVLAVGAPEANAVSILELPRGRVRAAAKAAGDGNPIAAGRRTAVDAAATPGTNVALQHLRLAPEDAVAVVGIGDAPAGGNGTTGGAVPGGSDGLLILPPGAVNNGNGTVTVPVTGYGKHLAIDGRFLAISASDDVTVLQWNETSNTYGSSVSLRGVIDSDEAGVLSGFEGGALALNADRLLVAAPAGGTYAFHYEEVDGKWLFDKVLTRPTKPVAVAMDDTWAVVGGEHRVVAHRWVSGHWQPSLTLTDPSKATGFVYAAAVSLIGGVAVVGEPIFGAVHAWDLRVAPTPSPPPAAPPTPEGLPLSQSGSGGQRAGSGGGLVPIGDLRRGDWVEAWVSTDVAPRGGGSLLAAARSVASAVLPAWLAAVVGAPLRAAASPATAALLTTNTTRYDGPDPVARRIWSPVVLVQHASSAATARLLTLTVHADAPLGGGGGGAWASLPPVKTRLTLTPNHALLTALSPPRMVAAGALSIGARLYVSAPGTPTGVMEARVASVSAAPAGRVVNVHTAAGTVVVGGVLASCYPVLTLGRGRLSVATAAEAVGVMRLAGVTMVLATAAGTGGAMEVGGVSLSGLLGALLVAAVAAAAAVWGPWGGSKSLPPPPPLPPLSSYLPGGVMFRFYTAPHTLVDAFHALSAALGPTFRFPLGPRIVTVTCVPADCARIAGRPGEWVRPPAQRAVMTAVSPGGLFVMPRPNHAALRRGLRGVFGPAQLPAIWPALQREMNTMVEKLERDRRGGADGTSGCGGGDRNGDGSDEAVAERGGVVDISSSFNHTTYRLILNVAFGASYDEATMTQVVKANGELLKAMLTDIIGYPVRQWRLLAPLRLRAHLMTAANDLRGLFRALVNARLAEAPADAAARPPDLLDSLLDLGGRDDPEAAVSNALILGAAGGSTTADTAAWTVYHIARTPGCAAAVVAELDAVVGPPGTPLALDHLDRLHYLRACWKETLRLTPPGAFLERIAARDAVLPGSGLAVAAGTSVLACLGGAHRDVAVWPRGSTYEPRRWLPGAASTAGAVAAAPSPPPAGSWMPFSLGPENCAGAFLADVEGLLLLATLYLGYTVALVDPGGVSTVTGWTVRAGSYDPAGPPGNLRRGVAVTLHPRKGGSAAEQT